MAKQITSADIPFDYNTIPGVKEANNQKVGSTLAEKIATCLGEFGDNPGVVRVREGDTLEQHIVTKAGQSIQFFDGDYKFTQGKRMYADKYSCFRGQGWNTRIFEPVVPWGSSTTNLHEYILIANKYALSLSGGPLASEYGGYFAGVNEGIEVAGIQFVGYRGNQISQDCGGIALFNTKKSKVHHCWFNGLSGYNIQYGANASNLTSSLTIGREFAEDNYFFRNILENISSQHIAVINSVNLWIDHNLIKNPGKRPLKILSVSNTNPAVITFSEEHNASGGSLTQISGALGMPGINGTYYIVDAPSRTSIRVPFNATSAGTYTANSAICKTVTSNGAIIDFEANTNDISQRNVNFHLDNNIFDLSDCNEYLVAIAINNPVETLSSGGSVSNNELYGNQTGVGAMTGGIHIDYPAGASGAKKLSLVNNYVEKSTGIGMLLSGENILAAYNRLVDCGLTPTSPMMLKNLKNSTITHSTIKNPTNQYSTLDMDGECFGNDVSFNKIGQKGQPVGGAAIRHGRWQGGGFYAGDANIHDNDFIGNRLTASLDSTITETPNSNNNLYDGNITGRQNGLVIVGAGSKVITHKSIDGKITGADRTEFVTQAQVIPPPAILSTRGLIYNFRPLDIPDENGAAITQITDSSGSNNHWAAEGTAATFDASAFGGAGGLLFGAGGAVTSYSLPNILASLSAAEIFIALELGASTGGAIGLSYMGGGSNSDFLTGSSGQNQIGNTFGKTASQREIFTPVNGLLNSRRLLHFKAAAGVNGHITRIDTKIEFQETLGAAVFPSNPKFGRNVDNLPLIARVGEIAIYNRELSLSERAGNEQYFKQESNLTGY